MGGSICAAVAKKLSNKKVPKKIRLRKMIFRPYYGCVIRRRILSHTHTHADTLSALLRESWNLTTAPKEAQKSNLMTEAVNLQHNIARGVSHLIAHLSVFRRSHYPAASPTSLPLSSSLSLPSSLCHLLPVSYVFSLLPLLSCDPLSLLHRINRLGIPRRAATGVQRTQQEWYFAGPGTSPANSIKA